MNIKLISALEKALRATNADGLSRTITKDIRGHYIYVTNNDVYDWDDIVCTITAQDAAGLVEEIPDDWDQDAVPNLYELYQKAVDISLNLSKYRR